MVVAVAVIPVSPISAVITVGAVAVSPVSPIAAVIPIGAVAVARTDANTDAHSATVPTCLCL